MKPILFNTEMVQAIQNGRKVETRRLMKPQPVLVGRMWRLDGAAWTDNLDSVIPVPCHGLYDKAPFHPGDILYVRETWTLLYYVDPNGYTHWDQPMYYYAADGTPDTTLVDDDGFELDDQRIRWSPSIHMPKEAARIFLRVKSIWAERLNIMQEEDAIDEGFKDLGVDADSPLERFAELWDKTIKRDQIDKYGWYANPWVWVIRFERCEKPED